MNIRADIEIPRRRERTRRARTSLRALRVGRVLVGGRPDDLARLPRYLIVAVLLVVGIWAPIAAYLAYGPVRYTSHVSLILPGAGSSSSVNLSDIGQASSFANSPYSSSAISPTVTYQRLISSERTLLAAAAQLDLTPDEFGEPRIKLVDQTSLILIEMTGASPEEAQRRAKTLTTAFLGELDILRADELARREASAASAIQEYQRAVDATRREITALQRGSGLISVAQYNEIVSQTELLDARVRDVEAELRLREGSVDALIRALAMSPESAALTLKLHADEEFRALATEMSTRATALAVAPSNYGDKHPELIAARDAYRGARARLYDRAQTVTGLKREMLQSHVDLSPEGERAALLAKLVTLVAEREGFASELAALSEKLEASRARMLALIGPASALDDLNRDYQVAEAVFASALARSDTSKADIFASYPLVQLLQPASLPQRPSSPRRMIALAAGVAASICLLIALVLAWVRRPIINALLRTREQP